MNLEITNIWTIFELLRICGRLEEVLKGYDERIIKQAFHSACLFGFAIYHPTEVPSIVAILRSRPLSSESRERRHIVVTLFTD